VIHIGYDEDAKRQTIAAYCQSHDIRRVVVISHDKCPLPIPDTDQVKYSDVIMYVTFYRLLQEIDRQTLVVVNECLRTQNRHDLAYNCVRNYLNQTDHQLIFQWLPQIDEKEDFMILFDFATKSRWKRRHFDIDLILDNAEVKLQPRLPTFNRVDVATTAPTRTRYHAERDKLFANLGTKDPHTLPRNLYLIGGKDKLAHIDSQENSLFGAESARYYVARNQRLKRANIITYEDANAESAPYTAIELPHRFIDFSDFLWASRQTRTGVLVADLKVDEWYFNRYTEWSQRIHATCASLQQR